MTTFIIVVLVLAIVAALGCIFVYRGRDKRREKAARHDREHTDEPHD
jgi:heme/copper-type cytochrome/quinol oxidase subunit 2